MLTPVVCFTCGMSLGDIGPIYHYIRRARIQKYYDEKGIAPTRRAPAPGDEIPLMGDVIKALGVSGCCATHLSTSLIFRDHY